jgi:hypothetical protein
MKLNLSTWPVVPAGEKRMLYHAGLEPSQVQSLTDNGWYLQDVRMMPSGSMEERREAVLAYLEGIRVGTIEPNTGQVRFIELESRACGLFTGKGEVPKPKELSEQDIEQTLDFGRRRDETEQ